MKSRAAQRPLLANALLLAVLPCAPVWADVTFLGDWSDFGSQFKREGFRTSLLNGERVGWEAGHGANHWGVVQEKGEDRLRVEQDPTSPTKAAVLRVEVRPGDYLGYSGERAEVSDMLNHAGGHFNVTPDNGHEVYGISIKLDPGWQSPAHDDKHGHWQWGVVMQLHSPNQSGGPPAFALTATDHFGVSTLAGDLIGADGKRRDGMPFTLTDGTLSLGHWVEFLIDVNWTYEPSGSLTIYRRNAGQAAFVKVFSQSGIPTLQYNSQLPDPKSAQYLHYWKVGYYRSVSPGVTNVLWLGPIVRGTSTKEVALAAFGSPFGQ